MEYVITLHTATGPVRSVHDTFKGAIDQAAGYILDGKCFSYAPEPTRGSEIAAPGCSEKLRTLLLMATKQAGSYEPTKCLHYVDEQLTAREHIDATAFLTWVVANGRGFGHGNFATVWSDWMQSKEVA